MQRLESKLSLLFKDDDEDENDYDGKMGAVSVQWLLAAPIWRSDSPYVGCHHVTM